MCEVGFQKLPRNYTVVACRKAFLSEMKEKNVKHLMVCVSSWKESKV